MENKVEIKVKDYKLVPYGDNGRSFDGYAIICEGSEKPAGYVSIENVKRYREDEDALFDICYNIVNLPF